MSVMLQFNMVILWVHHLLGLPLIHITSMALDRVVDMAVLPLDTGPNGLVKAPVLLLDSLAECPAPHHAGTLHHGQPGGTRAFGHLPGINQTQQVGGAVRLCLGLGVDSPDVVDRCHQL